MDLPRCSPPNVKSFGSSESSTTAMLLQPYAANGPIGNAPASLQPQLDHGSPSAGNDRDAAAGSAVAPIVDSLAKVVPPDKIPPWGAAFAREGLIS
jgi:hypothetical protein